MVRKFYKTDLSMLIESKEDEFNKKDYKKKWGEAESFCKIQVYSKLLYSALQYEIIRWVKGS